jgi:hypothetical protein
MPQISVVVSQLRTPARLGRIVTALVIMGWLGMPGDGLSQCRGGPPAQKLPSGLSLHITTERVVHAELSNKSSVSISVRDYILVEWNYWARIIDSSGREAPTTNHGTKIRPPVIFGSGTLNELAPGETRRGEEEVTTIYDLSKPGKYSLQVCRDLIDLGNIYSNKIEILVTP